MSVHRMGFSLMPFGFFSSNPTIGISNPDFINQQFPRIEKRQACDPELDHQ